MSELHPSIVALVSLAANIAANHPGQGLCQIDRLKQEKAALMFDLLTGKRRVCLPAAETSP